MHKYKIQLNSEIDTANFASIFAKKIKIGDIIALYGDLGSGKTFFTKKLCKFLGVKENVSSPSFVILNEYQGDYPIFHLDLYRLGSEEELLEIGIFDFPEESIIIIEWPNIAENILPNNTIKIKFELTENEFERQLSIFSLRELNINNLFRKEF
ncbi:MAG: tRNA (adenosine(37)-N6)-threonylcarbamoyltransferase complex ATPase subunit type 1 TsaE [Candidatus Cloacimonetes bacterium]|nr:tRNA (adenosine(37)-N6)-threonylcarbamoyltransferase complex ATPase subunit type 1 TsaE [Candidatus Cloacimonadota bacterium]